jgi:DNA-binding transcriptional LysR family regulator
LARVAGLEGPGGNPMGGAMGGSIGASTRSAVRSSIGGSSAQPLEHDQLLAHRAVAVADTAQKLQPLTRNLLPGQDVLTVPTMRAKLEALLRGLGCGYLPEPLARPWLAAGKLVRLQTVSGEPVAKLHYAWRAERGPGSLGRALQWWLTQLESPHTRQALIERHLVDGTNAAP